MEICSVADLQNLVSGSAGRHHSNKHNDDQTSDDMQNTNVNNVNQGSSDSHNQWAMAPSHSNSKPNYNLNYQSQNKLRNVKRAHSAEEKDQPVFARSQQNQQQRLIRMGSAASTHNGPNSRTRRPNTGDSDNSTTTGSNQDDNNDIGSSGSDYEFERDEKPNQRADKSGGNQPVMTQSLTSSMNSGTSNSIQPSKIPQPLAPGYSTTSVNSGYYGSQTLGRHRYANRSANIIGRQRFQSIRREVTVDTSRAKSNRPAVSLCIDMLGWKEYENGRSDGKPCNIYWHNVVYPDLRDLLRNGTKVNKFPGMNDLARKIPLTRALASLQKLFPGYFDFYPHSWILPEDTERFYEDYNAIIEKNPDSELPWFIAKPDDGAQGSNIYLLNSPEQIQDAKYRQIVQDYIINPYLLNDQLKFDLRVYVVIKSLNPLNVYISKEGMARFCTRQYQKPNTSNQKEAFMHLTNYSLNKNNSDYKHSTDLHAQGNKRLLSTVFHQLEAHGVNTRKIWQHIKLLAVKTVLALVPEMMLYYEHTFSGGATPECFHIMGFDIIITDELKPVLLEINACPSLSLGHDVKSNIENISPSEFSGQSSTDDQPMISVVDEAIKMPLVRDTLLLAVDELGLSNNRRAGSAIVERHLTSPTPSTHSVDENSADLELTAGPAGLVGHNASVPSNMAQVQGSDIEAPIGSLATAAAHLNGGRPCLREIFPAKYQQVCQPFLILDKAAYLFLHFVQIRQTLVMSSNALRYFVRKCGLVGRLSSAELDLFYKSQQRKFCTDTGIPFHGFVEILFALARRQEPPQQSDIITGTANVNKVQPLHILFTHLIDHCVAKLRHMGVRSSRLRHKAVDVSAEAVGADPKKVYDFQEIYMLPNRVQPTIWRQSAGGAHRRRGAQGQNQNQNSQPGQMSFMNANGVRAGRIVNGRDRANNAPRVVLPKIQQANRVY